MKNYFFILVFLISCSKTKEVEPESVAFEHATMKPWFDAHCASCHATGKSNYLLWHYNPKDYSATFSNHNINHIYELVYEEKRMPKDKKLSNAEIAAFKTWYDAGFVAK